MSDAQAVPHPPAGDVRALLDVAGDWYWETDAELRLTVVRACRTAAERAAAPGALARAAPQWIGKCEWEIPGTPLQPASWTQQRRRMAARRPFRKLIVRRTDADGQPAVALLCGTPLVDANGSFTGYAGIGRDITAHYPLEDPSHNPQRIDPLTGLLGRETFDERAQQVLANAYALGGQCALVGVGVDRFDMLNRVYGRRVVDGVLAAVADRLRAVIRPPHLLARRGAGEFVALLIDIAGVEPVLAIVQEAVAAVLPPERIGPLEVSVRASAGVAFFPKDGGDLAELLGAGDAALFRARESADGVPALFTPELARRAELRARLEQRLRKADQARDFRIFYQPLVSLPEGRLVGAEALLRWHDAELGQISPAEFIPIAEESGLISGLGDWVLRESCRQRQLWRQIGLDLPPIAINVSGVQMRDRGFVDRVLATLDEFDVSGDELEIEITETGLMDCSNFSRESLQRLRAAGIKAALDDFGVGYSSLAHLRDLPMHRLKIDRSFTVECMRDARTLTIVKAVIDMAHNLGLTVTAEGIETEEQCAWMHQLGCDSAQGYFFARPMAAEDFLQQFLDGRVDGARAAAPSR